MMRVPETQLACSKGPHQRAIKDHQASPSLLRLARSNEGGKADTVDRVLKVAVIKDDDWCLEIR